MTQPASLKTTPLHAAHRKLGAKMVDFGGWDMPVQYSGIIDEHHAVRNSVGLFDVSHMGEIEVFGEEALALVNFACSNDASKLKTGQVHYSGLLYDHGGFVDDILVHKVSGDSYFLCVNASNQDKDFEYIQSLNRWKANVAFASDRYAQLAVQGPKALATLQKLTPVELAPVKYYWFADGPVCGVPARIARTGYTGEDGFEVYAAPEAAAKLWDEILAAGQEFGIKPCGLGARNTLRLEARMALYGHEIDASIRPFEAGLDWIVKMDKGEFMGRAALATLREEGLSRKLVGFEMRGRGIGRDGYEVHIDGAPAGWVTSGGPAPSLNKNIGLCYLPAALAEPGLTIHIIIRGQPVEAVTVPTPFYKRAR
ncbi:MAG TPA: glycine cleavage system aminomethyltransferase GcvT [Solibacterales bacterium]|nr:glycine cleavage system aminomethyltransferase GcvT [Bryobacterales bacterium]